MVRDIFGNNYANTEQFGELNIIIPSTKDEVIYGPSPGREKVINTISNALSEFSDNDHLFLPGDPAFILPAIETAARCNDGRVQFLKWDEPKGFYNEEKVDLSGDPSSDTWLRAVFRIQELLPLCIDYDCQLHGSGADFWHLVVSTAACLIASDEENEAAQKDIFSIRHPLPEVIFMKIIEALRKIEIISSDKEKIRLLLIRLDNSKQREKLKIDGALKRHQIFSERFGKQKWHISVFVPIDDLLDGSIVGKHLKAMRDHARRLEENEQRQEELLRERKEQRYKERQERHRQRIEAKRGRDLNVRKFISNLADMNELDRLKYLVSTDVSYPLDVIPENLIPLGKLASRLPEKVRQTLINKIDRRRKSWGALRRLLEDFS